MSATPSEVTGATLVRFGVGIRVPVTTTSATSPPAASAAWAWVAARPSRTAPQIVEEAIRRSRMVWIFKVDSSSGRIRSGRASSPQKIRSRSSAETPVKRSY